MTDDAKTRDGDQPLPTEGVANVLEAIKADLDERTRLGIQRYGRPLQTFNGRDALRDAYEESIDQTQYLKQAIMERDTEHRLDVIAYLKAIRNLVSTGHPQTALGEIDRIMAILEGVTE